MSPFIEAKRTCRRTCRPPKTQEKSRLASGNLRRVRIQYAQLRAAKVSNPIFEQKSGNSPDISKGISQLGMYEFESSQVSHAVRPGRTWPPAVVEKPAISGLLQFNRRSPGSHLDGLRLEIAESLRPFIEIFPFLGNGDRRLGSTTLRGRVCSGISRNLRLGRRRSWNAESALRRERGRAPPYAAKGLHARAPPGFRPRHNETERTIRTQLTAAQAVHERSCDVLRARVAIRLRGVV
jgi:hypothetical protein